MISKELDELLTKAAIGFDEDEKDIQEYHRQDVVMEALRLAYNKGVTDSAESAEAYMLKYPLLNPEPAVNKQSILKNLIP